MTAVLHVGRAVLLVAVAVLAGIGAADIINQVIRGRTYAPRTAPDQPKHGRMKP